jgi:hypothetical protein
VVGGTTAPAWDTFNHAPTSDPPQMSSVELLQCCELLVNELRSLPRGRDVPCTNEIVQKPVGRESCLLLRASLLVSEQLNLKNRIT